MIVSNVCRAYRIKPERDKFRATPKSRVGTSGVERRERPPTEGPLLGAKRTLTNRWVIMAGKIPASDFAAVVDAVEQRRAMEEYGHADWVIHAIN
jgi:hypothetical protein